MAARCFLLSRAVSLLFMTRVVAEWEFCAVPKIQTEFWPNRMIWVCNYLDHRCLHSCEGGTRLAIFQIPGMIPDERVSFRVIRSAVKSAERPGKEGAVVFSCFSWINCCTKGREIHISRTWNQLEGKVADWGVVFHMQNMGGALRLKCDVRRHT